MSEFHVRIGTEDGDSEAQLYIDEPDSPAWQGEVLTEQPALTSGEVVVTIVDGERSGQKATARLEAGRRPVLMGKTPFI